MGEFTKETDVLVIGGGPGGYAAAFRAADLGMDVTLVDTEGRAGGVCLFRGCIPSKALLHAAELLFDARRAGEMGIVFSEPEIDLEKLRNWKEQVVDKLAKGLVHLCDRRGVDVIKGRAGFESADRVRLFDGSPDVSQVKFRHAIIATGSMPIPLPGTEFDAGGRLMSSTGALRIDDIPKRLLVVGGGYVGLELGTVYASLGSRITVAEMTGTLMPGADRDLLKPLNDRLKELFDGIYLNSKVEKVEVRKNDVEVTFSGEIEPSKQAFDRVLVAIGRKPRTGDLGLENTKVELDKRGFIRVDSQQRTGEPRIYAIGDAVGGIMLAHKAMYEGRIAADVIAGEPAAFDARAIPAVVYTDPQVAWCGLTESEAREQGRQIKVSRFPWSASGRAATIGESSGVTKMIIDAASGHILGLGITGRDAGEMIAEGVLAIEMGALAEDVALSIHPHPTLSEGEEEAAGAFLGSATHILPPKKKK
jgi:dihydrolipoamide dehydrogenase